jgi:isorenieratene synthase
MKDPEWVKIKDPKVMWEKVSPTAYEIYPELKDMKILGYTMGQHENFPSYAAKQESFRPDAGYAYKEGIQNLALAGDWLKTSYPSALMERAVATGREAANYILLQDGIRQVPMKVTNAHGPGII